MKDLSPKARAVVDVGRDPGVFTPADRDRIRRGLRLRLATLGTVTTTAGTAAAMSMTAKIALVTAVAAVLGGGGVASFWALRARAPAPGPATRASSSPTAPAAASLATATPAAEAVAATPPLPPSSEPSAEAKKANKRPAAAGGSVTEERGAPPLDSELILLRQAREDLRTGSPGSAYQRLVDYDRRYGKGPLWQERQALSAIALCQWHPGPQAQARASEFLRHAPESPLADRVRSACGNAKAAAE